MRYIGSKASVLSQISNQVKAQGITGSICDPFGGIGSVGNHFKEMGFHVYTGDILDVAHCFQVARIAYSNPPTFKDLRKNLDFQSLAQIEDHLNHVRRKHSWLHREYSEKRSYFTSSNAGKIEAVRLEISRWRRRGWLNNDELSYLRAGLIEAMDKVANTAGTYYAHLKQWDRKALQDFSFRMLVPTKGKRGRAFLGDALTLLGKDSYDVVYLDPPYNGRNYARYYHLPNALAMGRAPLPFGASGVDQRPAPRSAFNSASTALDAARRLIAQAQFNKMLLFHYTDSGNISLRDLRAALRMRGTVKEVKLHALGYSSTGSRYSSHCLFVVVR